MLFTKTIKSYRVMKHRGFYTAERYYCYRFLGIAYKWEWLPITESRINKKLGIIMDMPLKFTTELGAREWIKRDVNSIITKASYRMKNQKK